MRNVGVTSRGIRLPVVKEGEDLAAIVVESLLKFCKFSLYFATKKLNIIHISTK